MNDGMSLLDEIDGCLYEATFATKGEAYSMMNRKRDTTILLRISIEWSPCVFKCDYHYRGFFELKHHLCR